MNYASAWTEHDHAPFSNSRCKLCNVSCCRPVLVTFVCWCALASSSLGCVCSALDLSNNVLNGTVPAALLAKFSSSYFSSNCFEGESHSSKCPADNVTAAEKQALVDLYTATTGTNWDTATDPVCVRPGRKCDWCGAIDKL